MDVRRKIISTYMYGMMWLFLCHVLSCSIKTTSAVSISAVFLSLSLSTLIICPLSFRIYFFVLVIEFKQNKVK